MPHYKIKAKAHGKTAEYTLSLKQSIDGFMFQTFKYRWPVHANRKQGELEFDMPGGHENEIQNYLKNVSFKKSSFEIYFSALPPLEEYALANKIEIR